MELQEINSQINDLVSEVDELEEDAVYIGNQITEAIQRKKYEGVEADPEWFSKAQNALAIKNSQIKRKNRKINQLKELRRDVRRELRETKIKTVSTEERIEREKMKQERLMSFERCFVDVAKEKLKPKSFEILIKLAQKRLKEKEVN